MKAIARDFRVSRYTDLTEKFKNGCKYCADSYKAEHIKIQFLSQRSFYKGLFDCALRNETKEGKLYLQSK